MCKGVAVMRRRCDSWLNATQILKVAGFDKPQRTRVLEREVQKGEHEKVQGGYGKYQGMIHCCTSVVFVLNRQILGTWIPLERGLALAKQYNCDILLRPIIEFQPAAKSPPLAPKHLVSNAAVKPIRKSTVAEVPTSTAVVNTRSSRRHGANSINEDSDHDTLSVPPSEDGSMTPAPSEASSSSRTPSPIQELASSYESGKLDQQFVSRREKRRLSIDRRFGVHSDEDVEDKRSYADQVLEYFISDSNQIPSLLVNPPPDFDPNMAIDDDGHTPLHWACAMGRIRIVKLLLTAGADIFKVNKAGQTALMRSVMFANNYDVRKFPELYELLHRSTLNIDNYNRTVFHHIIDVAMTKGKTHAARYYMETVLNRLSDYPRELADVINFQDEDGETALTLAARCRSRRLVKLLIDHGANPKVMNNDGKSPEDYILEDERLRSSPAPPSRMAAMSFRNAHAAYPMFGASLGYVFAPANGDKPPLHHSVAAQKASTRCVNDIAAMMDSLAGSFDQELKEKERDITQAHAVLANMQAEILESQRTVSQLKTQAEGFGQTTQHLNDLEIHLLDKMGRRYRLGWEKWLKGEEMREKQIRDAANGELLLTPTTEFFTVDEDAGMDVSAEGEKSSGKRKAKEDISDLVNLYSGVPTDPAELRQECEVLREEVTQYTKRRKIMFGELVAYQAEAGTSGQMGAYRRLIGAGCGGIPPAEVDAVLGMLLEVKNIANFVDTY
jgi:transcription factor MBP1